MTPASVRWRLAHRCVAAIKACRDSTIDVQLLPVCASEEATVGEVAYGSLASVYEWLVPDDKASPAGSARAFEMVTAGVDPPTPNLDRPRRGGARSGGGG